ncbi:hypothetical protein ACFS2C_15320 [Prauserella oleivorans]|uniref:Uncharacterized protein n=1 Tax=Prauserella oleivorans TaxID=1478153 RepID=A0ABW5WAE8_9PSEU
MSSLGPQTGAAGTAAPKQPLVALAAVLCLAAAALTVVGSFLPIFTGALTALGSTQFEMSITSWGFETDAPTQEGGVANNGVPLMIAAALLCVAAAVLLAGALRGRPDTSRVATPMTCLAAAFVAGVTVTVLMQALSWQETFRPTGTAEGNSDFSVDTSLGLGVWLFAGATVLALAAAGVALRPRGRREPTEPETPRYGFPAPMQQGGPSVPPFGGSGQAPPRPEGPRQGPGV